MITLGLTFCNEESIARRVIERAVKSVPKSTEIIIVSEGTDGTNIIVHELATKHKNIKVYTQTERRGKSRALNIILKGANGDIIILVDGDALINKDAVDRVVRNFEDEKVGAVSGKPVPLCHGGVLCEWYRIMFKFWHMNRMREKEKDIRYTNLKNRKNPS